jgi:putative transposase
MPWKETNVMDEKMSFVGMYLRNEMGISELCRYFGISRVTGYKWIRRYETEGPKGLDDRDRAPYNHRNAIANEIEQMLVSFRGIHSSWGPLKLLAKLSERYPKVAWPAASTIGEILKRHGLTISRRRSRKSPPYEKPFQSCQSSNTVWSADFKGWFCTKDGQRCDPFTLTDNYSRFLLRCQSVTHPDFDGVKPILETAFKEYGLPLSIRTDNGPPFATTTIGGLSRLSVWLMRLGITPERIQPGKPAQNGRLERLHRTLKAETAQPPQATLRAQQKAFDRFREEYNYQRPHQALNQKTPASHYTRSSRTYPPKLPELSYPDNFELRKIRSQGEFKWRGHSIYLCMPLSNEIVAFQKIHDDLWNVYFGPLRLAVFNTKTYQIIREKSKVERINIKYETN